MATNDSPANEDGPFFLCNTVIPDDVIRVTCKVSTLALTGEVELALLVRANDGLSSLYAGVLFGDDVEIFKLDGTTEATLAVGAIFPMSANDTCLLEYTYDRGTMSFVVKDASGTVLESVTATDPSPLSPGKVGFAGEIDGGSDDEWLYFDDFKVEKYE